MTDSTARAGAERHRPPALRTALLAAACLSFASLPFLAINRWSKAEVAARSPDPSSAALKDRMVDRSPVDLAFLQGEKRILVLNQTSNSISCIDRETGRVVDEVPCGERPCNLCVAPDGKRVLASANFSGEVIAFRIEADRLERTGSIRLGFEPRGLAIAPDGKIAYVALSTAAAVAVIDLEKMELLDKIAVGRWPRELALSPDGSRLAVGCNGDGGVAVVDTIARKQLFLEDFSGLNLGQMQVSQDGLFVYFPWIVYRHNPITEENIRRGWVLASRIARVRLDRKARREAIALDPRGQAVGDPYGLALSPDQKTLVCTASGTHELLVFQLPGLPLQDYGGPGDHIDEELLKDSKRFYRIPLGGRPMAVRYSESGKKVLVANYLLNAVQVVDLEGRRVEKSIPLGPAPAPTLTRQGEIIFFDATRSLDQWYSCHSCHYEGHTNAVTMDTRNDGRFGNFKTVLSLRESSKTGRWFWHGWATEFPLSVQKSLSDTMLGKEPTDEDVTALSAYLETLKHPVNPHRVSGTLSPSAKRGQVVFQSEKAGCANCHPGPSFTDGKTYDVGLGSKDDFYDSYKPPSLRGLYDRILFLHDGRSKSLTDVLRGPHNPDKVTGLGELSEDELRDLIAYLETL